MAYEIKTDHDSQMVILQVSGIEELETHKEICEQAAQTCFEGGFTKLLIDLREIDTANIASFESGLEFGSFFANDPRLKNVKVAQVLPKEMYIRVDIDFSASIAEMRGKTIGRFTTVEEAIKWLNE